MFIRSERLFLRPAWPEDGSELRSAAHGFAAEQAPRHPLFVITLPDDDGAHAVGMIALVAGQAETELVIGIAPQWRSRGFASEAARAVLALAPMLGHCRIVAHHFARSPATGCVLARLGFVPTGEVRLRYCAERNRDEAAHVHALELCPPERDPADPAVLKRAA